MKFRPVPAIFLMLSLCVTAEKPAYAGLVFWKSKKKPASTPVSEKPVKPNKNIRVTETQDFIILFFFTGRQEKRPNESGESHRYVEISYKFSIRAEDPAQYFGGAEAWMKVRFLDSEGFSLAEDQVNYKDLLRGKEHYGFAWVEERKAGVLRKADLKPLKQHEIPVLAKVQEAAPNEAARPVEKLAASVAKNAQKPAVTPVAAEAAVSPQPEPAAVPAATPAQPAGQPPVEEEAGLTRGGATNAEVTAALEAINKKPPTEIPEGRDSLPPGTGETKEA